LKTVGVVALLLAGAAAPEEPAAAPVMVYLADGSSLPLQSWSLSYEYVTWVQGTDPALATAHRREAKELWVGKKRVPTGGLTLEIRREPGQRQQLALAFPQGKKEEMKVEPPSRDLLAAEGQKGLVVARSLDLRGETLTATKRELCLLAYTQLVECGQEPEQRVVKIEFPR
jgi:hypothetical protein